MKNVAKIMNANPHFVTILGIGLLIFGVLAYMYFLSLSVVHVVVRKEVLRDINSVRSELALLEAKYIEANHIISTRVATLDGFSEVQDKVFINAVTPQGLVLRTTSE